jgi:hypothetical protein
VLPTYWIYPPRVDILQVSFSFFFSFSFFSFSFYFSFSCRRRTWPAWQSGLSRR